VDAITEKLFKKRNQNPFLFVDISKKKIPLLERVFKCPVCGKEVDKDVNSAMNILK
jgi:transposase